MSQATGLRMGNIEYGTCPNCNEWAIDEDGICTECGWRKAYDDALHEKPEVEA